MSSALGYKTLPQLSNFFENSKTNGSSHHFFVVYIKSTQVSEVRSEVGLNFIEGLISNWKHFGEKGEGYRMSSIAGYRGTYGAQPPKKPIKSLHDSASSLSLTASECISPEFGQVHPTKQAPDNQQALIPMPQSGGDTLGVQLLKAAVQKTMKHFLQLMPDAMKNRLEHKNLFAGHYRNDLKTSVAELKTAFPDLALLDQIEEVRFRSSRSQQYLGWFVPPKPGKPTILQSMGNVSSLSTMLRYQPLIEEGYGFMVYEYPGYGSTPGKPTEEGINQAGLAASDFLRYEKKIPRSQQVFYGISLGGTVTATLASERPCRGVIMESTMTRFPDVAKLKTENYVPSWIIPLHEIATSQMESEKKMRAVNKPLLVMHGTKDSLMPISFAERLFKSAATPENQKKLIRFPGQGHNIDSGYTVPHIQHFMRNLPPVLPEQVLHEQTIDALCRATLLCIGWPYPKTESTN